MQRALCISLSLWTLVVLCSGCGRGGVRTAADEARTYFSNDDVAGERVELRLLDSGQIAKYVESAGWKTGDERIGQFNERRDAVFGKRDSQEVAIVPILAPIVAGLLVDFVKSEIEKEAAKYERQFVGSTYDGSFWSSDGATATTAKPNWQGFELTRWTNRKPKTVPEESKSKVESANAGDQPKKTDASAEKEVNEPAFRLVCAIVPEKNSPFFLLRPLFLQTQSAKAKIIGNKLTTRVNIAIDGSWIDRQLVLHQGRIGSADWTVSGMKVGSFTTFRAEDAQTHNVAGWFLGVPRSYYDATGDGKTLKHTDGAPFKLTVMITERDETRAQRYVERLAKFIGEKKSDIVGTVTPGNPK